MVGPNALAQLSSPSPIPKAIEPFAEFGIILLLFSIGLELSFRRLWRMRRLVFGVGAAELIGSAPLIGLARCYALGESLGGCGRARPGAGPVLDRAWCCRWSARRARSADRRWPCCCSRIWRSCRSSSLLGALGPVRPRRADVGGLLDIVWIGAPGRRRDAACSAGYLLPRLFAQAARTKSPELFLSASLLVVIVASLATAAVGLSPIMRRAARRHPDRRDRISWRGRGDDRAVPRPRPRRLPDHGRHERSTSARSSPTGSCCSLGVCSA